MRRSTSFYSSTLTYFTLNNDETALQSQGQTMEIPISSSNEPLIPITVHLPPTSQQLLGSTAATKIQSIYRSHLIRNLFKKISAVNSEANHLQHLIQRQETVDSIRTDDREKLKMNEALMSLLLKLDSVPGIDPAVKEARRRVSRRIVGLQEILDAVSDSRVEDLDELMRSWEEVVVEMERGMWEEKNGWERREMERFCFEKLGFRCMERFLRGV